MKETRYSDQTRASSDMLPFNLCNKKSLAIWHMNRPLFRSTLSIPSYDIRKKVGLRTYQHPCNLDASNDLKNVDVVGIV